MTHFWHAHGPSRPRAAPEKGLEATPDRTDAVGTAHAMEAVQPMPVNVTLLELVNAITSFARSDEEIVATIVHLVNSGQVRLCGSFRGARFRLEDMPA